MGKGGSRRTMRQLLATYLSTPCYFRPYYLLPNSLPPCYFLPYYVLATSFLTAYCLLPSFFLTTYHSRRAMKQLVAKHIGVSSHRLPPGTHECITLVGGGSKGGEVGAGAVVAEAAAATVASTAAAVEAAAATVVSSKWQVASSK